MVSKNKNPYPDKHQFRPELHRPDPFPGTPEIPASRLEFEKTLEAYQQKLQEHKGTPVQDKQVLAWRQQIAEHFAALAKEHNNEKNSYTHYLLEQFVDQDPELYELYVAKRDGKAMRSTPPSAGNNEIKKAPPVEPSPNNAVDGNSTEHRGAGLPGQKDHQAFIA